MPQTFVLMVDAEGESASSSGSGLELCSSCPSLLLGRLKWLVSFPSLLCSLFLGFSVHPSSKWEWNKMTQVHACGFYCPILQMLCNQSMNYTSGHKICWFYSLSHSFDPRQISKANNPANWQVSICWLQLLMLCSKYKQLGKWGCLLCAYTNHISGLAWIFFQLSKRLTCSV